jgi:hypothetical protein|mmetsp:Transcript_32251/g.42718  ORF Transcript_32251/g.42718 Transcript_32251/m.42718 type:complete len:294 (-) Transcript_32251:652-1533(-)
MFDKLGSLDQVIKTVYHVNSDWKTLTQMADPREEGIFFAESCYVIHLKSNSHEYFINWLGPKVTSEHTSKMADAMNTLTGGVLTSDMTRMRVRKGHEDEGMLAFFPEGFLILDEARVPLDEWLQKTSSMGTMFRVQAPFGEGARAIEQNSRSSMYLNSGDSFSVVLPDLAGGFVWQGLGSEAVEKDAADRVFNIFNSRFGASIGQVAVAEGSETGEFWDSIGGEGEYSKVKESLGFAPGFEPRLFQVSNSTGYMWMEELPAFAQEDLINEDCYILDAYNIIYTWIGNQSNKFE